MSNFIASIKNKGERIPKLVDLCVDVLYPRLDELEYLGNITDVLLYKLLARAIPSQLERIGQANQHLNMDPLWFDHCKNTFGGRDLEADLIAYGVDTFQELYQVLQEEQRDKMEDVGARLRQKYDAIDKNKKKRCISVLDVAPVSSARRGGTQRVDRKGFLITPNSTSQGGRSLGSNSTKQQVSKARTTTTAVKKKPNLMAKAIADFKNSQAHMFNTTVIPKQNKRKPDGPASGTMEPPNKRPKLNPTTTTTSVSQGGARYTVERIESGSSAANRSIPKTTTVNRTATPNGRPTNSTPNTTSRTTTPNGRPTTTNNSLPNQRATASIVNKTVAKSNTNTISRPVTTTTTVRNTTNASTISKPVTTTVRKPTATTSSNTALRIPKKNQAIH